MLRRQHIAADCRKLPLCDGKVPSRDQRIVYNFKRCFRSSPFLSLALDPCLQTIQSYRLARPSCRARASIDQVANTRLTNYTTIKLRLSQIKKTPLAIAPFASNLLISYRLLSSTLLTTLIRALLSLAKSPLPYPFSLQKSLTADSISILTIIN